MHRFNFSAPHSKPPPVPQGGLTRVRGLGAADLAHWAESSPALGRRLGPVAAGSRAAGGVHIAQAPVCEACQGAQGGSRGQGLVGGCALHVQGRRVLGQPHPKGVGVVLKLRTVSGQRRCDAVRSAARPGAEACVCAGRLHSLLLALAAALAGRRQGQQLGWAEQQLAVPCKLKCLL